METTQAIQALSALAQESRLAIFRLLVQAGPSGLAAGAIGEVLDLPAATLSFHLAGLTRAGRDASMSGMTVFVAMSPNCRLGLLHQG